MRRRDFIKVIAGSAVTWPLAAHAQQTGRMRRIGLIMALAADDPESLARIAAFLQGLQKLGWTVGRNVQIDYRWSMGDAGRSHRYAEELLALTPDVILAHATPSVVAVQQLTRTVPIVFNAVTDPVGAGFVESLARPGGNATGFISFEYSISPKWLELLKEIAPRVTRAAVIRDPTMQAGIGQLAAIHAVAPSFGVELSPIGVRESGEIDRAVTAFASGSNVGLIVTSSPLTAVHRDLIISLAGAASTASGLPPPLFCYWRRPDLLRT
jgi:ABC-type uncharacterized transport system substrate-binding protein